MPSRSFRETCQTLSVEVIFEDRLLGATAISGSVIDVEVTRRWRSLERQGVRSPVSAAVYHYNVTEDVIDGIEYVTRIMDDNNDTGCLKEARQSLVELIRSLGAIGTDKPSVERRLDVIEILWPGVWSYFAVPEKGAQMSNPFTLPNVMMLLKEAGVTAFERDDFQGLIELAFQRCDNLASQAVQKAEVLYYEHFKVEQTSGGGEAIGHFIRTDDTRIAKERWKMNPLMMIQVIQRRSGHVAVMCRGQQSMERLYLALEEVEPGVWFYKPGDPERNRSPIVQNGGTITDPEPTQLLGTGQRFANSQLFWIIRENYRHWPRSDRR